jgi:steroid delta-isomerase-like uncharacterized protein
MSEENQRTLERFIDDVWNRGDLDTIDAYLSGSYTVAHDPGDPWDGQTLSVEGFRERVRASRAPIPDQSFDIRSMLSDEKTVCITWLWRGTHRGEIAGFAPTGRELTMSGATVYYFEDGKITGHWQIADRLGIYQQLMSNAQGSDG